MKRFLSALVCFLTLSLGMGLAQAPPAGFVVFTASRIQNQFGAPLAVGTLTVMTTNGSDVPIPAVAGGVGGAITNGSPAIPVTAGAVPANTYLADTLLSHPVNISYRITVRDSSGVPVLTLKGVQPSSSSTSTWCFTVSGVTTCNLDLYQPNVAPLATIQIGPQGPTGPAGVASLPALSTLFAQLPLGQNLHKAATDAVGYYLITGTGTLGGGGAWTDGGTSDYFPVNAGGQMVISPAPFADGGQSVAFYDQNKTYIGDLGTTVSAGVPFSVPPTAALGRTSIRTANLGSTMIEFGSTSHPWREDQTASYSNAQIDSKAAAASAAGTTAATAAIAKTGPLFTGLNTLDLTKVTGSVYLPLGSAGNLSSFDSSSSVTAAFSVAGADFIAIGPLTTGNLMELGGNNVYTFYDAAGGYAGGSSASYTPGAHIAVPPNAVTARVNFNTSDLATAMIIINADVPSTYRGYGISGLAASIATSLPGTGKKIGLMGDSYTAGGYYQAGLVSATGLSVGYQDALGSRFWFDALEGYCGGTTGAWSSTTTYSIGQTVAVAVDGSAVGRVFVSLTNSNLNNNPRTSQANWAITIGTNSGSARGGPSYNTGTLGNTLAQDLTASGVSALAVYLGTNDVQRVSAGNLGAYGDAANAQTVYGDIRSGIELIQAQIATMVNPIPLILVGPMYQTSHSVSDAEAIDTAMEKVAADYGVPVLNGSKVFGVSPGNASVRLADGIHPTSAQGNKVIGPSIGREVLRWILGS